MADSVVFNVKLEVGPVSMFTVSGYQLGHVGNAGIGTCLGPGNNNVDFGVDKNFKITERIKAQFRFEFFNIFNHPSYSAPLINNQTIGFNDTVYGDASGKVVPLTSASRRQLQNLRSQIVRSGQELFVG